MWSKRVLAGAVLPLCFVASAEAADGWYVSLEAGGDIVDDWEHTRTRQTPCGPEVKDAVAAFENGWAGFGAAGFAIGAWRLEFEGGYRQNDVDSYVKNWKGLIVREGGARPTPTGELSEATLMFNVIYDVPIFERFSLAIGLGAGANFMNLKLDTLWAPIDEGDWHLTYHGLAGVNYALTEMTVLFLNYRFANVSDVSFDPTSAVRLEGDEVQTQTATAGVRFALAAPEGPVAPPPATPQPVPLEREFMVFFGFNRYSLTPQALATIKEAVESVKKSGSAAIRVVGHADRAGSVAYNKALSVRRAKSVKGALIKEGLAENSISVSGRGESEPMVPTADGVRESQNRRVHISF